MNTTRHINAPVETVFTAISSPEGFSNAVPDIKRIEYVSDIRSGIGARFRETRQMGRREATTELEITEFSPNHSVRYVSDAGGTIWDTIFTVEPEGDGTRMTMNMDARPHKLAARVINPLIMGMVRKAVEKDMDAIKSWCETNEQT